jgi:hypothetical protein
MHTSAKLLLYMGKQGMGKLRNSSPNLSSSSASVSSLSANLRQSTSQHCTDTTPARERVAPAIYGDSPRRQTSSAASPVDAPSCVGESLEDLTKGESAHTDKMSTGTKVPAAVTCSNSRINTRGTPMVMSTRSKTRKSTTSNTSATTPPELLQPAIPTQTRSCGADTSIVKRSKIPVPVIQTRATYQSIETDKHVPESKGKLRSHGKKQIQGITNFQIAKVRKLTT